MNRTILAACTFACVLVAFGGVAWTQEGDGDEKVRRDLDEAKRKAAALEERVRQLTAPAKEGENGLYGSAATAMKAMFAEVNSLRRQVAEAATENIRLREAIAAKLSRQRGPAAAAPAAPGTPTRLCEDVLAKARELRLLERTAGDAGYSLAVEEFNKWLKDARLDGSAVDGEVMLLAAEDADNSDDLASAEYTHKAARSGLSSAQDALSRAKAAKAPAKTRKELEERVAKSQESMKHWQSVWEDERVYRVELILSPPGRPDIQIRARAHVDDRDFLGALPPFSTFKLKGELKAVRFVSAGKDKWTPLVELVRCRAAAK
jgi:hypothetical protein